MIIAELAYHVGVTNIAEKTLIGCASMVEHSPGLREKVSVFFLFCFVIHSVLGDCTTVRPPILLCEFVVEVCFLLDGLPVLWYESSIYPCFV